MCVSEVLDAKELAQFFEYLHVPLPTYACVSYGFKFKRSYAQLLCSG